MNLSYHDLPDDMRFEPISQQAAWDGVNNDPADQIMSSLADHIIGYDLESTLEVSPYLNQFVLSKKAPDLESTLEVSPYLK